MPCFLLHHKLLDLMPRIKRPVLIIHNGEPGERVSHDYFCALTASKREWVFSESRHTGGSDARPREYEERGARRRLLRQRAAQETRDMKRIGLLGGMSWESSAEYYRLVNEATRARLGGLHSAECILRSVNFAAVDRLQRDGRWNDAGALLAAEAAVLVAAGAELIVLCTNTLHMVNEADRRIVHSIIYDELCRGVIRSRAQYRRIIAGLTDRGARESCSGAPGSTCSSGLRTHPFPSSTPPRLHAQRAVQLALSNHEGKAHP